MLSAETIELLAPRPGGRYLDGTLGGAGHTALLLERTAPDGQVLALDADPAALERVRTRLAAEITSDRLLLWQGNFAAMGRVAVEMDFTLLDGILLDLGFSSDQLAERERGFSFATDAPLDMRFDPTRGQTAAELVNTLEEVELADLLYHYGEERRSRAIARRIVERRGQAPIERTGELARLIESVIHGRPGGIHPATRTFQALRIAVNDELTSLEVALPAAVKLLRPGGRLAVISFHSLEDRLVKHAFRRFAQEGWTVATPRPLRPSADEVRTNPRARSARLRVLARG